MTARGDAPPAFVTADARAGVDLAVRTVGASDAPALVVAHGVGSSARFVLEAVAPPAVAVGWRVVTYDLRGHGDSSVVHDPSQHALHHHVDDLHAVVTAHAGRAVAGVSLGGHAAVAYVAWGGAVDAVGACLPAWTGRSLPGQGPHAVVAAEARLLGIPAMLERIEADRTMAPWLRDVLLRDWPRHDETSLVAALGALDGGRAPTEAELRGLAAPLAVVGWPDDPGHPLEVARDWAGWAPRGALEVTGLDAVQENRSALGTALVDAFATLGLSPSVDP